MRRVRKLHDLLKVKLLAHQMRFEGPEWVL